MGEARKAASEAEMVATVVGSWAEGMVALVVVMVANLVAFVVEAEV